MPNTKISPSATNTSSLSKSTAKAPHNNDNSSSSNHQYLVSRNGIVLSWEQIYAQHQRQEVDEGNNNDDGDVRIQPLDSNTLLQLLPRGAYTTCRTVKGGSHIYQFELHVKRLADSAKSILVEVQGSANNDASSSCVGEKEWSDKAHEEEEENTLMAVTSNHPIQHDRILSTHEINHLDITNVAWERNMALKCIRNTLREFCARYGLQRRCDGLEFGSGEEEGDAVKDDEQVEFKITLLATWEKKNTQNESTVLTATSPSSSSSYQSVLYCHVGLLKPKVTSAPLTRVLIHGHGRENALAKDSKWVLDREKLTRPSNVGMAERRGVDGNGEDDTKQACFEEVILINDKGELLEGTQTNFYVVSSSAIITANEGILYGSVRDSVLRACQAHNIPVELRPPTLQDLKSASGVFISSTSRWVMPVHEVCLGDLLSLQIDESGGEKEEGTGESIDMIKRDGTTSYFYGQCNTTENIRRWVLLDVKSRSTPLFG